MRNHLPHRRNSPAFVMESESGQELRVQIGNYDDGKPGEIFIDGPKIGSDAEFFLHDACILASRLLQHGFTLKQLAAGLSRSGIASALRKAAAMDAEIAE